MEIKYAVGYAAGPLGGHGRFGRLFLQQSENLGSEEFSDAKLFDTAEEALVWAKSLNPSPYPHFVVVVEVQEPTERLVLAVL